MSPTVRTAYQSSKEGPVVPEPDDDTRFFSASLLKPVYAWIAGPSYRDLAEAAIRTSSNTATDLLIERILYRHSTLTAAITKITQVNLNPASTWGRFSITAAETVRIYSALNLAAEEDDWAQQILLYMTRIYPDQRFAIDTVVEEETQKPVALKTGWDLSPTKELSTHAVCLVDGKIGVVLSSTSSDAVLVEKWERTFTTEGPSGVLPLHEYHAGPILRERMRSLFTLQVLEETP